MSNTKPVGYVRLGQSGLKVSKIILGCMSYGSSKWSSWVLEEQQAIDHIKYAYEQGINTFDTANVYSNGQSEVVLGNAIKKLNLPRDEIVIMSKVYFWTPDNVEDRRGMGPNADPDAMGGVNQHGLSRKHIFDSVKKSLARLQLDYIDVLQCHRFDKNTPISETMEALHDVVKAGYVRYIGMSSCYAYQFHQMQNYAIQNKLTPFISMQNHYNLAYREEEREMMPSLKAFGVGCIPWSPLARGFLTKPLGTQTTRTGSDAWANKYGEVESNKEINRRVEELSKQKGVSMAQIGLAWLTGKDGVTAPIVGTTSLENLKDLIAGLTVELSKDDIKFLEEVYKPQEIFGHW